MNREIDVQNGNQVIRLSAPVELCQVGEKISFNNKPWDIIRVHGFDAEPTEILYQVRDLGFRFRKKTS